MVFRGDQNYQTTIKRWYIFQTWCVYIFQSEQNYQNPMKHSSNTYMHILIFNWCAQTSRLPNLTYHYMLRFIKKKSLKMQKLLNYQWMMIYMFHISLSNCFQMWTKLRKYLWNIRQTSTCICEFSKTTRLPMNDDVHE